MTVNKLIALALRTKKPKQRDKPLGRVSRFTRLNRVGMTPRLYGSKPCYKLKNFVKDFTNQSTDSTLTTPKNQVNNTNLNDREHSDDESSDESEKPDTKRPFLSAEAMFEMRDQGIKVLCFRSYDLDVVQNQTITPQQKTNPLAPPYVYLGLGFGGFNYGPCLLIVPYDSIHPLIANPNSPGEYVTPSKIPPTLGWWSTAEEYKRFLKIRDDRKKNSKNSGQ